MNLLTKDLVVTASTLAPAAAAAFQPWAGVVSPRGDEAVRSNILGVTGLPRRVLVAMYCRDGLFGRDSRLTPAERAVIRAALPELPGLPALPSPTRLTPSTPDLLALAEYVSALAAGRTALAERRRLKAAGMSEGAINETAMVVDNVRVVFAPQRQPAAQASTDRASRTATGSLGWAAWRARLSGSLVRLREFG